MVMNAIIRLVIMASVFVSLPVLTDAPAKTFTCADSLDRSDGQPRKTHQCQLGREYCFEASGGPAVSHGAECRPLANADARCDDFDLSPGVRCHGTAATGLRVHFAFP